MNKNEMFYSCRNTLRHNSYINMVIGNRGAGKTFDTKRYTIDKFLKKGTQFVYLRRYQKELETSCDGFYDAIKKTFPDSKYSDLSFTSNKKGIYIDKKKGFA